MTYSTKLTGILCISGLLFSFALALYPPKYQIGKYCKTKPGIDAFSKTLDSLVDSRALVGVEVLLVCKHKKILHKSYGSKDQAANEPLETGTIYNIRSMTKPMAGTIAQILVDRGLLNVKAPVAAYLEAFGNEKCKNISVEHLLLHRSGYEQGPPPQSWSSYQSLEAVANDWAEQGPTLPVGEGWSYADANADIFGAVVESITGKNAAQLLQEEIFDPLKMNETFSRWTTDKRKRTLVAPLYRKSHGHWQEMWSPKQGALYTMDKYAQSVYCSANDYLTFMQLWMKKGKWNDNQIISPEGIKRAFSNREALHVPPGLFPLANDKVLCYGHFWGMVFEKDATSGSEPFVFMHQGSDGTAAYGFPQLGLIAVVMSQSRGNTALPLIEQSLKTNIVQLLLE